MEADRNRNDFAQRDVGKMEISYSSKLWFPDYIFTKINFVKGLNLEPLIISRRLILKERESFDPYDVEVDKDKVLNLEAKYLKKKENIINKSIKKRGKK